MKIDDVLSFFSRSKCTRGLQLLTSESGNESHLAVQNCEIYWTLDGVGISFSLKIKMGNRSKKRTRLLYAS